MELQKCPVASFPWKTFGYISTYVLPEGTLQQKAGKQNITGTHQNTKEHSKRGTKKPENN